MSIPAPADLQALMAQYESGKTLPQGFYLRPELFDYEMAHVVNDTWFFARHSSELPAPGDYAVLQIGRVSLIIVRGRDNVVRAFHNVCAHRAAKLCTEAAGSAARITCPYHGWTYSLDGRLLSTQFMPADFQKDQHGLRPAAVAEDCGLIFVNLDVNARPFASLMAPHRETLQYHGIDQAQVGARRQYLVNANWKLAIENFTECYHCAPSHKTLTRVMSTDRTFLVRSHTDDPTAMAANERFQPKLRAMEQQLEAYRAAGDRIPHGYREPLAPGFETGSVDGKLIFPPMTEAGRTVGTESVAVFEIHTGYMNIYEDYSVLLSYVPLSHEKTLVELTWFVSGRIAKPEGAAVDKLVELWDITTREDGWLSENQVAGVQSPYYQPGTLSNAEVGPRIFLDWYIERLRASFTGETQQPHNWAA